MSFRIKECFLFVCIDEDGDEGVVSFFDPVRGVHWPMVATDQARVDSLRPVAEQSAKALGKSIRIVRLHLRHDVEVILP